LNHSNAILGRSLSQSTDDGDNFFLLRARHCSNEHQDDKTKTSSITATPYSGFHFHKPLMTVTTFFSSASGIARMIIKTMKQVEPQQRHTQAFTFANQ
jgi:hypothetical protein